MTLGSGIAFAALMACTAYVMSLDVTGGFFFGLLVALPLGACLAVKQ